MHRIGIDLGGTKTEGILLDGSLGVVSRKRIPTPKDDYRGIVGAVASLVAELAGGIEEYSVGVCTPGAVARGSGLMQNSNTGCLSGAPLGRDLGEALGRGVALENDANCFAAAEATLGSARGHSVVFGVIMGTGVGGGIAIDGRVRRGRLNIAGEWGHAALHPGGNACYCGRSGCAEAYLSGPALEGRWRELTGRRQALPEIVRELDSPEGRRFKRGWLDDFGLGLANVIDVLDPDAVVLGGGVSNVGFLYTEGRDAVYERVFADFVDTPILRNQLGDSAGVFGAALLE